MSEANKILARNVLTEMVINVNMEKVDEYYAQDVIIHVPFHTMPAGHEGIRGFYRPFEGAFSDIDLTFEDQIAEDDRVVTRFSSISTQTGRIFGVPNSGKRVAQSSIIIHRMKDGKVTEQWTETNTLGLMQQLGAISRGGGRT